jgi:hypothetical protein
VWRNCIAFLSPWCLRFFHSHLNCRNKCNFSRLNGVHCLSFNFVLYQVLPLSMLNGKYFCFLFRDVRVWNLPRSSAILIQMLSTLLKIHIIKPNRCTNFSNIFILEWNFTYFGQFLCPSSGVFHCTHNNVICHTGLLTAVEQDQDGTSWSYSTAVSKPVWHITLLCVKW